MGQSVRNFKQLSPNKYLEQPGYSLGTSNMAVALGECVSGGIVAVPGKRWLKRNVLPGALGGHHRGSWYQAHP